MKQVLSAVSLAFSLQKTKMGRGSWDSRCHSEPPSALPPKETSLELVFWDGGGGKAGEK